jgi:magnesium transporter
VVDEGNVLLGRITIDDVVDIIREQAEHQALGAAGLNEDEDLFSPVPRAAKRRAIWLGINLATAFLASWVIGRFEGTLERIVALAVLMPIVASMGGVAGTQTLTLMVRGLALGQVARGNLRPILRKEVLVGLLNGVVWAVVVGIVAGLWFQDAPLGMVIAAAMVINLAVAALAGVLVPLTLKRMDIDPALAGGVVLTTVTDVVGFLSFLGLATLILLR